MQFIKALQGICAPAMGSKITELGCEEMNPAVQSCKGQKSSMRSKTCPAFAVQPYAEVALAVIQQRGAAALALEIFFDRPNPGTMFNAGK